MSATDKYGPGGRMSRYKAQPQTMTATRKRVDWVAVLFWALSTLITFGGGGWWLWTVFTNWPH